MRRVRPADSVSQSMPRYIDNFASSVNEPALGVMLVNLGTPESPTVSSVRKFLREFLSDSRVVELPSWIWFFILNGVILRFRPSRSLKAYQKVWTKDGSPLLVNTSKQTLALERELNQKGEAVHVRYAMRYGEPSIATVIDEMTSRGIGRIVVLPMYPQYSGSTIGSVFDEIGNVLKKRRFVPSIRFISGYSGDTTYIECLASSVRTHWQQHGKSERLVMSFHGLPQAYVDKGDPYENECRVDAQMLAQALELRDDEWSMCFQSRVGAAPWLKPYTDDVLSELTGSGIKSIDMMCPGFSADCLETLEEVNIGYRELFMEKGGKTFRYIPCLNDSPDHIGVLVSLIRSTAGDWL